VVNAKFNSGSSHFGPSYSFEASRGPSLVTISPLTVKPVASPSINNTNAFSHIFTETILAVRSKYLWKFHWNNSSVAAPVAPITSKRHLPVLLQCPRCDHRWEQFQFLRPLRVLRSMAPAAMSTPTLSAAFVHSVPVLALDPVLPPGAGHISAYGVASHPDHWSSSGKHPILRCTCATAFHPFCTSGYPYLWGTCSQVGPVPLPPVARSNSRECNCNLSVSCCTCRVPCCHFSSQYGLVVHSRAAISPPSPLSPPWFPVDTVMSPAPGESV
jgi:hypothetical protein